MSTMFDDVKIGDTVFVRDIIRIGSHTPRVFWCQGRVIKVTRTQFVINSGVKFRKNGEAIANNGGWDCAIKCGASYDGSVVVDESVERRIFLERAEMYLSAKERLDRMQLYLNGEHLEEACCLIDKLNEVMK